MLGPYQLELLTNVLDIYIHKFCYSAHGYQLKERQKQQAAAEQRGLPFPKHWNFTDKKEETVDDADVHYLCEDGEIKDGEKVGDCQCCSGWLQWRERFNIGRKRQRVLDQRSLVDKDIWAINHDKNTSKAKETRKEKMAENLAGRIMSRRQAN